MKCQHTHSHPEGHFAISCANTLSPRLKTAESRAKVLLECIEGSREDEGRDGRWVTVKLVGFMGLWHELGPTCKGELDVGILVGSLQRYIAADSPLFVLAFSVRTICLMSNV